MSLNPFVNMSGDPGLSQLYVDPFLDPIRDDPRFNEMLEKLGFDTARS